jgi:hypothetical protein
MLAGVGLPDLPVVLGGDFAFLIGGGDRVTLENTDFSRITASTSSDIIMLHFFARLQPATGRFRPFLDALIGFKHFETRTSITEHLKGCFPDPNSDIDFCTNSIGNKKNSSDLSLSYGLGAGLDVVLYAGDSVTIFAVVAVRYLFGETADYVIPSSIRFIDADTVEFVVARTRTDLLTTQLGFGLRF